LLSLALSLALARALPRRGSVLVRRTLYLSLSLSLSLFLSLSLSLARSLDHTYTHTHALSRRGSVPARYARNLITAAERTANYLTDLRTWTSTPGPDCLIYADFARQRRFRLLQ